MSVLTVCPSRNRPTAAHELLRSFEETVKDPGSRLVFIVDSDDPTLKDYPQDHVHVVRPMGFMGGALRSAPDVLGDATAVGLVGDDCRFRSPGWDVVFGEWLTENVGIAYGDDGFQHERLPTHWWLSRPLVDAFGMTLPELRHYYMDNYWLELGRATGTLRYFPDVSIEHLHPLAGKANEDALYRRNGRNAAYDRRVFTRWKERHLAGHAAKLRQIAKPRERRTVLADWHHPALWESLEILFSDRFGWDLYSPHGLDWKAHGWRFERPELGEGYFLTRPAIDAGDHFEIASPEYPGRPRKAVTWEQAKSMGWDFVLTSVPQHQQPFAQLARDFGARLIHQVGNAKHWVHRPTSQVILASSNAVHGDGVIRYHQEFDLELFGYRPPYERQTVSSFMLRMDTTSCDYSWLDVEQHGVEMGHPDYLAPMTRVADVMAGSGWIWHDKMIGDGYGHVVHNAAAIGRPLIGHASHYKGMMAEPFWRDLETCVDLDKHPPEKARRLIRAIGRDEEWHTEMCEAIAAEFRARVDFNTEAQTILAALA